MPKNTFLSPKEKMEIARQHGVRSWRQIYNITRMISRNDAVVAAWVQRAEENKKLYERANELGVTAVRT